MEALKLAHCLSKGYVLQYDTENDLFIPVCDDWTFELYNWVPLYIEKMKADLIDIGAWEIIVSNFTVYSSSWGVGE